MKLACYDLMEISCSALFGRLRKHDDVPSFAGPSFVFLFPRKLRVLDVWFRLQRRSQRRAGLVGKVVHQAHKFAVVPACLRKRDVAHVVLFRRSGVSYPAHQKGDCDEDPIERNAKCDLRDQLIRVHPNGLRLRDGVACRDGNRIEVGIQSRPGLVQPVCERRKVTLKLRIASA